MGITYETTEAIKIPAGMMVFVCPKEIAIADDEFIHLVKAPAKAVQIRSISIMMRINNNIIISGFHVSPYISRNHDSHA